MSKAFTRESDESPDLPPTTAQRRGLSPGVRNYLTPDGAQRMREELESLVLQRKRVAVTASESGDKVELRACDHKMLRVQECLRTAHIVPPPPRPWRQVSFGAIVTVRDRDGREATYRIVGVDETDPERDWVSWQSPIARALLAAQIGQKVRFKFPAGEQALEILHINFP